MTKVFTNRAWMTTATVGTGTLTLAAALGAYQSFAASGVADGDTVSYLILEGDAWEIGEGVYAASGTTLTRSVVESSNAGALLVLTGSATVMVVLAGEDIWSTDRIMTAITAAGTGGQNQPLLNGLVSGGSVINTTLLEFASGLTTYYIDGVLLTAAPQLITLDAADPTDDRFDVIALDDTGTLVKITGTPDANPSVPTADPSTQLALTIVSVPAGATTVPGVANEDIYDLGAVWTITTNGTTWNTASAAYPTLGATAISAAALTNGAWIRFNRTSGEVLDPTDILNFNIQSLAAWPNKRTMQLQFRDTNNVAVGVPITLKTGAYGFDSSDTTTAQLVAIPVSAFNIPGATSIQYLQMTNAGGAIGFGLQPIGIQSVGDVVVPPGAGGITQADADVRYAQRALNLSDLVSASTARTNLGLGTAATANTGTSGATVPLLNAANNHSGLVTLSAGANLALAAVPASNAVGFLNVPQLADQDDYTLALADAGGAYYHVSGTPHTLTIPADGTIAFPIGTVIEIFNENGAGALTIAITSDTLRWTDQTGSRTLAANGCAAIRKMTSTMWRLVGSEIT